jgi:hypothetical protein
MWKTLFEKLRREHPTVKAIEMVFNPKRFECESSSKKLEEVLQYLTELFIEILYNGADEAILGITSMKHIESYFRELERIFELISIIDPIYN